MKRRKKKDVVSTKRAPKFQRSLQAAWKGFKREAQMILAAIGFVWLLVALARLMGGG